MYITKIYKNNTIFLLAWHSSIIFLFSHFLAAWSILRLRAGGTYPRSQNPCNRKGWPLELVWKALDTNKSGMVLYSVLLPANWVCRNNLNLCIHVNSSYFLGEAIVTIPSFSPFHVSVFQSALFCLAFYFADVQSVASALRSFWGCFITQSSDVSLGESRGDLEERRKTIVGCVLFSSPLPHQTYCLS